MPSAFDVLGNDHEQVKQLLSKFEMAPAAAGTNDSLLATRKKMAETLVIEESKHEAIEEMYFWPAVRKLLPDGDKLADQAISQEQEGKELLAKLGKLDADNPEFDRLLGEFIKASTGEHMAFEETQGLAGPAGRHDRDGIRRTRRQPGAGPQDRPDQAAPAHAALAGRAEDGRPGRRRGRPGQGRRDRPGPGLTGGHWALHRPPQSETPPRGAWGAGLGKQTLRSRPPG